MAYLGSFCLAHLLKSPEKLTGNDVLISRSHAPVRFTSCKIRMSQIPYTTLTPLCWRLSLPSDPIPAKFKTELDTLDAAAADSFLSSSLASTHTHTHPFNGPFSRTTQVSRYQKGKPNLDFTEARDSEWQWHQLEHMQVCTSLQTDNHASTPPLSFLQARCPSCCPTNSVKALKAHTITNTIP